MSRLLTRSVGGFQYYQRLVLACKQKYHSRSGIYGYKPAVKHRTEPVGEAALANRIRNSNLCRLVDSYRCHGHRKAALDPLRLQQVDVPQALQPERYGLSRGSGDRFDCTGIYYGAGGQAHMTVEELVQHLEKEYCGSIAAEFQHLRTEEEREWFAKAFESKSHIEISPDRKVAIAKLLLKCQAFDHFLANKFTTVKRYGGEGGESMMCVFDEIFKKSARDNIEEIVICMPHRGRLNFLTCMLDYPAVRLFGKMRGKSEIPAGAKGMGDVLSHAYTSVDLNMDGKNVHVSLIPNPSHLEANNPVAVGKVRSKQQTLRDWHYNMEEGACPGDKVLCLQVHGDASFAAQGIVTETFSFAECPHFSVGGSVHLIVNNQIGFTTEAERGRSSLYSSDLAKINGYPVLHINADFPEDVVRATAIAMDYRKKFRKDVILDFICFRKYGHNELDDPLFTQPVMYQVIQNRKSIPDMYANRVTKEGLCSQDDLSKTTSDWNSVLSDNLKSVDTYQVENYHLKRHWLGLSQASDNITTWDTGVPVDLLKFVGAKSVSLPGKMIIHPNIQKTHIDRRIQRMESGMDLDWSTAEALAMGTLMAQGYHVRISGQDVGRGTFSHRHCMLVDQETDEICVPLNHIDPSQTGFLEVANSVLSEEAVLGFEYGMSIDHPNTLVLWEAQFGDFFNGAQPIIDTYVSSGEIKWLLQSGLVMLLPHGMDGAGPEHSSCRMERFLQCCDSKEDRVDGDDVNMQVVNPTTPAQYFHLLRRQMVRNFRKPLIVVAPKVLLRLQAAVSSLTEMAPGTYFHPVLSDPLAQSEKVKRVIFVSGKHYYALQKERENLKADHLAFIRLESLCPFPTAELQAEIKKFPNATEFIWSQEEHRNRGAWSFVAPRFENLVGHKLKYVGRDHLGMSAVGIGDIHKTEAEKLMKETFS
ncbi:hypothetical protein ACJMK2_037417 [Sinanodonta woodiana]|uniref:Transketolase-like pyrimidine-binding domain-containing protein n=1 Tax=Sinanodonta woodiana TaxID=1069815 RepID=A0ABD3WKN0_SINWO